MHGDIYYGTVHMYYKNIINFSCLFYDSQQASMVKHNYIIESAFMAWMIESADILNLHEDILIMKWVCNP